MFEHLEQKQLASFLFSPDITTSDLFVVDCNWNNWSHNASLLLVDSFIDSFYLGKGWKRLWIWTDFKKEIIFIL